VLTENRVSGGIIRRERAFTLAEVLIALPLTMLVVGFAGLILFQARVMLARASAPDRADALPAMERIRREIREARGVLYPAPCSLDAAASLSVAADL